MGFNFSETAAQESSVSSDDLDYDYAKHDNVCVDLIEYGRSRILKNEEQFLLTTLGYLSGYFDSPKHFICGVLIGTAGSGKSHVQNVVAALFDEEVLYTATNMSAKAIIYDRKNWNAAIIADMDELQKPDEDIIEILKSVHGGEDGDFVYKVTGDGKGADRETDEIVLEAMPYWFLFAQTSADFEMWDRLIKVPVHESRDKNEGVLATGWDHTNISFGDSEYDYMFEFEDGTKAMKDHMREIPQNSWVKIPAGEEDFGGQDFIKYAKPIFDLDRSETNRVGKMVANLVRASALVNHENREKRKLNLPNEGVKEAYIAEPQDLANILSCRNTLLATTHQIDRKKKALCIAIEQTGGTRNMSSIDDIQSHLKKTNASFVKRHQVEEMLEELIQNYLIEKHERAGENGAHLYEFKGWQNLGKFEIDEDFKDFFEGCTNPITGEDFIETARRINKELQPNVSDFMTETTVDSDSGGGQATLSGNTAGEFDDVSLEPHQEIIREQLYNTLHGERIDNLDEHQPELKEMLGLVPIGESDEGVDTDGTVFDPDHVCWTYGPDEWVTSEREAEREIETIIRQLTEMGVFKTNTVEKRGRKPLSMKVRVASKEDLQ